jgi:hypothetical protein
LCYRFSQIDGFGFFSLQSLIINSDGQSAAGYNRPFSNLAAGAFAFLVSLNAPWNEFLLLYTFWAVIPVIVINGILWIMKG